MGQGSTSASEMSIRMTEFWRDYYDLLWEDYLFDLEHPEYSDDEE